MTQPHRSSATVLFSSAWTVFGGDAVFGGLVISSLASAAATVTGLAPVSIRARLRKPLLAGLEATVTAELLPGGRTSQEVAVALTQGGLDLATAQVSVAVLSDPVRTWADPAGLPPGWPAGGPADGEPLRISQVAAFGDHYEIRAVGRSRPLAGGPVPSLAAWLRPRPGTDPAGASVLALLDVLPPALFAIATEPVSIPTVEFTAHLVPGSAHARAEIEPAAVEPAAWTYVTQRCLWSTDLLCVDEAEARAADGRVLARARQLRRILTPR